MEKTVEGEVLRGDQRDISHGYYFGREMTLEDVEREKPDQRILISNMRNNDIKRVCWTRFGQALPLQENDVVLPDTNK